MEPIAAAPPLFWRIRRADAGGERFLVAFFCPVDGHDAAAQWSCDGIARTESEARDYATRRGVSMRSFSEALKRARFGAIFERPSSL
jgi:hypothetical protein